MPVKLAAGAAIAVALLAQPNAAVAQQESDAAQSAFEEGRRLVAAGDFAAACQRFEESQRLQPAVGTMLNLASCYESAGRLVSAWRAFRAGSSAAAAAGEAKRSARAAQRAEALEPRLSTLAVIVEGEPPAGLDVRIDGVSVGLHTAHDGQPVDGGIRHVTVSAPGLREWSTDISIAPEGQHATLVVAPLQEPPPDVVRQPPSTPRPTRARSPVGASWIRPVGYGVAATGLVAVGVGAYFGIQAIDKKNDSRGHCNADDACDPIGLPLRQEATAAGWRSTIAFVAGGAALIGGVALVIISHPAKSTGLGSLRIVGQPGGAGVEGAF